MANKNVAGSRRRIALLALMIPSMLASQARAQFADNPINQGSGTVTVNSADRVQSSNAIPAITLGGGTINNAGTVINLVPGNLAIQTGNGSTINNLSGGTITGIIQMQGNDAVPNVIVNNGIIDGNTGPQGQAIVIGGNNADTVTLNGGSTTTGSVNMGNNTDTLNLVGDGGTLNGDIVNTEIINKTGAGTFTFSGNSLQTTALTVSGGTLAIQRQPNATAIRVLNADTTINGGSQLLIGDGATFQSTAMRVSGTGSQLTVGSGGTVQANGATSFAGGANFSVAQGGTFEVQNLDMNASTGTVAGNTTVTTSLNMLDSNVLVTSTGVLTSLVDGAFTNSFFTIDAGGRLVADITYTNTQVTVNGTQDGDLTFSGTGRLKGSGSITGSVIMGSGTTLAPGNSPGTLNVGGDLTLNAGSRTEIELTAAANDLVNVGGVATLGGTLAILPLEQLRNSQTFTVISAPNNVIQGSFATIEQPTNTAVRRFTTVQNPNTFQIVFTRGLYEPLQLSVNQRGPANTLDRYLTTNLTALTPLTNALDALPTQTSLVNAFEQLHAEPFDAQAQIAVQDQQQFAGHIEQYLSNARLNLNNNEGGAPVQTSAGPVGRAAPSALSGSMVPDPGIRRQDGFLDSSKQYGGFGFAYNYQGDNSNILDAAGQIARTGFDYRHSGLMGGVDKKVGKNGIIGLTFAGGDVRSDFSGGRGRIDADTWDLGAYGTWKLDNGVYIDALVNYTNYDFRNLRTVIFPGIADANRSRNDGDSLSGYIGAGWLKGTGEWNWGPTASLQWTNVDIDGLTETGGTSALAVGSRSVDSLRSQLGVRATRKYEVREKYTFVPELRLRWAHEFSNDDRAITAAFTGAAGALGTFTSFANRPDRDSAYLGGSVNAFFAKNLSGFVSYDFDVGRSNSRVDAGRFGLALKF